jgi:hypothetical protein
LHIEASLGSELAAEEPRRSGRAADVARAHHKDREQFDIRHVAIVHAWAKLARQCLKGNWEPLKARWEIKGVSRTNEWHKRRILLGHSITSIAGFVSLSRRRRRPNWG